MHEALTLGQLDDDDAHRDGGARETGHHGRRTDERVDRRIDRRIDALCLGLFRQT